MEVTHWHLRAKLVAQFQSYFIQDYRWKWKERAGVAIYRPVSILLHSGLPLEDSSPLDEKTPNGWGFNPTSFRITVGRAFSALPGWAGRRVSILLHSGLPLEAVSVGSLTTNTACFNPTSFRITVGSRTAYEPNGEW